MESGMKSDKKSDQQWQGLHWDISDKKTGISLAKGKFVKSTWKEIKVRKSKMIIWDSLSSSIRTKSELDKTFIKDLKKL